MDYPVLPHGKHLPTGNVGGCSLIYAWVGCAESGRGDKAKCRIGNILAAKGKKQTNSRNGIKS
jgi:hypothetical protein